MNDILFWKRWDKVYRYIYIFLLCLFSASLVLYLICYFIGIEAVIKWKVDSELDNIEVKVDEFSRYLFNYTVSVQNYLIKQSYSATGITVNPSSSYIFLVLVVIGILFALTIITYLELFWYIVGIGIFMVFLVNLNTEILAINGSLTKNFLIVLIVLFGGVSYYFNAFSRNTNFLLRLLVFLLMIAGVAIYIHFEANVSYPFLYIANYGIIMPIAISSVFIALTGFEVINVFLYLTSSQKIGSGTNSLINFSVITILYLANVLLLFLKKLLIIDWDILYLNAFILFAISALLGIWGYRNRSILFNNILPFRPFGAMLYLSFGIITFATVGYSFITGNDPLTECFEYIIIYSHLCIGGVYFIYVIINFWPLFLENLAVYKVVYEPKRTPFFVVRGIGVIISIALFLKSGMFAFYLGLAGYYNTVGDTYLYEQNYPLAKEYYLSGAGYEFQNHRSNYSVASVALLQNDKQTAAKYFTDAIIKYPSEYDYINIANLYLTNDLFFQAMFTLQDGLKQFPKSGILYNNLAIIYSKTDLSDSTLYYLLLADNYLKDKSVSATNLLEVAIKKGYPELADSLQQAYKMEDKIGVQNNRIVFYNLSGKRLEEPTNEVFLKDSILTNNSFAYLYNLGVNKTRDSDTAFCKQVDSFEKREGNDIYSEDLRFVNALSNYYGHNKATAKTTLEGLQNGGGMMSNYYSRILALWMTEQKAYPLAVDYFKQSQLNSGQDVLLDYCIALAETGQKEKALEVLIPLSRSQDSSIKKTSASLLSILQTDKIEEALLWEEGTRYQYLHYRRKDLKETDLRTIYNSLQLEEFIIAANAELISYYLDEGNVAKAELWLNDPKLSEKDYYANLLHYQYLRLLAAQNQWQQLNNQLSTITFNKDDEEDRTYFKALAAEGLGQSNTEDLFKKAVKESPFNENAVISAASFYNNKQEQMKAYDLLVESVQLNPMSGRLLKAYALQSIKVNLPSYGESVLQDIYLLLPEKEYQEFKTEFEKQKTLADLNL